MSERFYNRDRNRFYNNQEDENFSNRRRDFEEDYDFDMRNRGYNPDYGRDFDQEFEGDWGRRQYGIGGGYGPQGGYSSFRRGGMGSYSRSGYGGYGSQGGYGSMGNTGRNFGRGFYNSDFDDEDDTSGYRGGYGQGSYGAYGQGGYGRGMNRGFSGQGYGSQGGAYRGYGSSGGGSQFGPQGGEFGQRYGNRGYSSQGSYRSNYDEDYDVEPGGWSYTEIWLIPGPFTGMGPQDYQRSDERIKEEVCERLTQHGRLDARNIHVQVNNGEVTLTGTVDKRQAKRMAEDTVDNISGVKDVNNQLRVESRHEQPGQGQIGGMQPGQAGTQQRQGQQANQPQSMTGQTAGQQSGQQRRAE